MIFWTKFSSELSIDLLFKNVSLWQLLGDYLFIPWYPQFEKYQDRANDSKKLLPETDRQLTFWNPFHDKNAQFFYCESSMCTCVTETFWGLCTG